MSEKNEWKPIESAPKDGQSILGWGPCQDAVVIAWNEWAQPEPTWEAVGLEVNGFECPKIVLRGEPTLWQPLPDEPSKYAGDHDGMENEPMAIWAAEQREATPAPSAPGDAQDERQAFEAWAKKKKMPLARIGEQYDDFWVDHAWNGWQARASVAAPAAGDALERQYTSAMGEAAQAYMDSFPFAHKLPAQFRWADLWTAMYGASHARDTARDEDVSTLLAFIFERFGQPGDAGELPDSVVATVRRLEQAALAAQAPHKGDAT